MKTFSFLLIALSLLMRSNPQSAVPSTEQVLKEAYRQAAKENKKVFIIFHASWCIWCHKMDSSLNDPSVKSFFDNNYVIRHLTVMESKGKEALENPGALDFMIKYGGKGQGIPYWLIFDKKGNLLANSKMQTGQNSGCPASKEEVAYFLEVLKKTTPLKGEQLALIEKRFRENEPINISQ